MIEWSDSYRVGIDRIDSMHEEMFNVFRRVRKIERMGGNMQWAVAEAVKYFISYARKHFEDEEDFMRGLGYTGYERHKAVHDAMRDKILPRIYSRLQASEYSDEAIEQFLSICEKWLARHILGHDMELVKWSEG